MARKYKKHPKKIMEILKADIKNLLKLALKIFPKTPELSQRYGNLARKLSTKFKIRLPKEEKRLICKYCHSFLGPKARTRTKSGKIIIYCPECKKYTRIPFYKERKEKRALKKKSNPKKQRLLPNQKK